MSASGVAVASAAAWFWKWKVCDYYCYGSYSYPLRRRGVELVYPKQKSNRSVKVFCEFDPELRSVLEVATESELREIERILFGPSYMSPLLKSTMNNGDASSSSLIGIEIGIGIGRQQFISNLESRFFFLAADARQTLRGWRPSSYRDVLLNLTNKLNIPKSPSLSTQDLELEIFLHILQDDSPSPSPLIVGGDYFQSILFKGGGIFTFSKLYQLLANKLSGKMLLEAANYQVKKELINKGGQLAMINLESRAALLAAKQGFLGAASRYLGFRSMLTLLGPLLWGTFLADLVIQMLGTDYARILRTVYALAQIRVIRTYSLPSDIAEE